MKHCLLFVRPVRHTRNGHLVNKGRDPSYAAQHLVATELDEGLC